VRNDLENIFLGRINRERLISRIQNDSKEFKECIKIAASTNQPQAWRATWILNHAFNENDDRVTKYFPQLFHVLENTIDGHQREILKLLSKINLKEEQEGLMFDVSLNIWESVGKIPSVRIEAFRFLARIAGKYPELKNELKFVLQEHYLEPLSPGIRGSVRKIWKELDKE